MPRVRQPPIESLTGARFVAAILVVCYHFVSATPHWLASIIHNGYLGVPFFFVLSGFILTYNYAATPNSSVPWRSFWAARFARIYPIYLLAMLLDIPFFLHQLRENLATIHGSFATDAIVITSANLTLTQSIIPLKALQLLNTPGWTLSVEACFYLVFPMLIPFVSRLNVRSAAGFGAINLLILIGLEPYVFPRLPTVGHFFEMTDQMLWPNQPLFWMPVFFLGAVIARLFIAVRNNQFAIRWSGPAVMALCVLLFAGMAFDIPTKIAHFTMSAMTTIFGVLIFFLAFDRGSIAAFLSTRLMESLGEASYALYILQAPVWAYLQQLYSKLLRLGDSSGAWFAILLILVLCVISVLGNQYFERPARQLLRRVLTRDQPIPATAHEPT